jgi:hypothetical protein
MADSVIKTCAVNKQRSTNNPKSRATRGSRSAAPKALRQRRTTFQSSVSWSKPDGNWRSRQLVIDGIETDPTDSGETPSSIQSLVMYLVAENQELKDRLNRIEEQLRQNSELPKAPLKMAFQKKGFVVRKKSTKTRKVPTVIAVMR